MARSSDHPEWQADQVLQLLPPKRLHGRRIPRRGGWSRPPTGTCTGLRAGGGVGNEGTVFKITPSGTLTTLHSFYCAAGRCTYGTNPGGLVQDTNGSFYGITSGGGLRGDGTVFSLSVGLGSSEEARPTSAKVGEAVEIPGTNLTDATSVSFNGTGLRLRRR